MTFDITLTIQAWAWAGLIFSLRVLEMTLDTLRMLVILRGRKTLAWAMGFAQALLFVFVLTSVLGTLNNPLSVLGYAAGFASGVVVGMWLEGRLAIGFANLTIISPRRGAAIAEQLRQAGFAVTEIPGRGKDGAVSTIICSLRRRQVDQVVEIAMDIDPEAFITTEDLRPLRRGHWRA